MKLSRADREAGRRGVALVRAALEDRAAQFSRDAGGRDPEPVVPPPAPAPPPAVVTEGER